MDNPFQGTTKHISIYDPSNVDFDWSIVDWSPGARVARGMLYVQRTYPDALSIVDIDNLDISLGDRCVLGQIHGDYGLSPEFENTTYEWRQAHGFLLAEEDEPTADWCDWSLNLLWRTAFRAWRSAP